jgi:opacity protein-like surface antigen
MNKILSTLIITSCLVSSALADSLSITKPNKETENYLRFNIAQSLKVESSGNEKKNGYESKLPTFEIGIGRNINDYYRVELTTGVTQYKYKNNFTESHSSTSDSNNVTIYKTMVNNFLDLFTINEVFTPYLMFGAGLAYIKPGNYNRTITDSIGSTSISQPIKSTTNLAWQAGAGLEYKLSEKLSLDTGYRYVNYGKFKVDGNSIYLDPRKVAISAHEFLVGLKYNF